MQSKCVINNWWISFNEYNMPIYLLIIITSPFYTDYTSVTKIVIICHSDSEKEIGKLTRFYYGQIKIKFAVSMTTITENTRQWSQWQSNINKIPEIFIN